MNICPICGQGELETKFYGREMQHKGVNLIVENLQFDCCHECGAELTSPEQMNHNSQIIRTAFINERERVKREQNLLTGVEIRQIRERLKITQKQAANIFGGGPNAFAKYEAEDVVQSVGMDKLIRLASDVPQAAMWLFKNAGEAYSNNSILSSFKIGGLRPNVHVNKILSLSDAGDEKLTAAPWCDSLASDNDGKYVNVA